MKKEFAVCMQMLLPGMGVVKFILPTGYVFKTEIEAEDYIEERLKEDSAFYFIVPQYTTKKS